MNNKATSLSNFQIVSPNNIQQNTPKKESLNFNEQNREFKFKCNICYNESGTYIFQCFCLYCVQCLKVHIKDKRENCLGCGMKVNNKLIKDLNKKENYEKYSFIFLDPELLFKQGLESYRFQTNYKDKHIKYLNKRLEEENNHKIDHLIKTNDTTGSKLSLMCATREVKRVSPKVNQSVQSINQISLKVENLNSRTAKKSDPQTVQHVEYNEAKLQNSNLNVKNIQQVTKKQDPNEVFKNGTFATPMGNYNRDFASYYYKNFN